MLMTENTKKWVIITFIHKPWKTLFITYMYFYPYKHYSFSIPKHPFSFFRSWYTLIMYWPKLEDYNCSFIKHFFWQSPKCAPLNSVPSELLKIWYYNLKVFVPMQYVILVIWV
jgi:hypothetical protein